MFVACGLFIALGVLLIPHAGIQTDEALFSAPLYPSTHQDLAARLRRFEIPFMVMTYLGSLKSFLYWPILSIFGANVWSIRLPVVLLGAATIFVFYRLVLSSLGRAPALLAAFLLATDPIFLVTNTFDWGPVALEHFLLVTGCWSLYQFGTQLDTRGPFWRGRQRFLLLGSFAWGLALWNKAIFAWALSGLVAGGVLVFWRWIWREATIRNAGLASAAFLVGASPLVLYNLRHGMTTYGQNAHLDVASIPGKWIQLRSAADGQSLFGYLVREESSTPKKAPQDAVGRMSVWLRERLGAHYRSGFYYVLGGLLLLFPWWMRSRAAWFSLIFCAVAWLSMASTLDAGGAAHHVVLLWPFPVLFAVAVLAAIRWRPVLLLAGIGLVGMNLVVVNQYLAQLQQFGAADAFTDAIFPLSDSLGSLPGKTYYLTDWGIVDSVNLLQRGRLTLRLATGPLVPETPSDAERQELDRMMKDPDGVFVGHVAGKEAFQDVGKHLDQQAEAAGLRRDMLQTVTDSSGHPMFEVFRLAPKVAP
ncbi:MAG: glycosyltransferase family 39 protein [Acidobacteriota bacterium]